MYDRKWLELQIVRMGEKYPDRVCSPVGYGAHPNHCMLGTVRCNHGACPDGFEGPDELAFLSRREYGSLPLDVALMNDAGVPWGEIPKRLGLVPGEQPAEPAPLVAVSG